MRFFVFVTWHEANKAKLAYHPLICTLLCTVTQHKDRRGVAYPSFFTSQLYTYLEYVIIAFPHGIFFGV